MFHSVYQEEKPLLSSGQQHVRISPELGCQISSPIGGLVCLTVPENNSVTIFNPGTKKFVTLPETKARERAATKSFFGYDEISGVFKVLCMTNKEFNRPVLAKEHQVFTVGSGQNSWRPISCKHPHSPVTEGLCKRGVLYYGARSNSRQSIVMSFNVSSEEFTVIELPEGVYIHPLCKLVNYNGNIALLNNHEYGSGVTELDDKTFVEMWVWNEAEGNWSRIRVDIPHWKETVGITKFYFRGTIGTGELVFASNEKLMTSLFVMYYDPATEKLTKYKIEGVDEKGHFHTVQTSLDHIDSPLLI